MARLVIPLALLLAVVASQPNPLPPEDEDLVHLDLIYPASERNQDRIINTGEDKDFWYDRAAEALEDAAENRPKTQKAKNVIMFLGDGMSIRTITLGRDLYSELSGETPKAQSFDKFPYAGMAWTYNINKWVTDSSAAATAYLCGVKGTSSTVGTDHTVRFGYCVDEFAARKEDRNPTCISDWSLAAGKKVGMVTTTTVTHGTPGSLYAHSANRVIEADTDRNFYGGVFNKDDPALCVDIASQFVYNMPGKEFTVTMGAGNLKFDSSYRDDQKDLKAEWLAYHKGKGRNPKVVRTREELNNIPDDVTNVLALFDEGNIPFALERTAKDPTLLEMVKAALPILERDNDKGYFLLVEAARIDHAHHYTKPHMAIGEMHELEQVIDWVEDNTDDDETLLLMTADHGHTITINGYPNRDTPIFGPSNRPAGDGKPYPILSYALGRVAVGKTKDEIQAFRDTTDWADNNALGFAPIPNYYENHGGDDVAIYAKGPGAYLLAGSRDNSYIPHVMAYASGVGRYANRPE